MPVTRNSRECTHTHTLLYLCRADSLALKAGDSVKIDLGVHIDSYIAVVAHTAVVAGESGEEVITGPAADVLAAAYAAAEAALRVIKPGAKNSEVTKVVGEVCEAYGVTPLQGVLMHQMKQ